MSKKKKVSKDTLIKREVARLTNLFKDMERVRKLSTNGLIVEASFMKATLTE